MTRLVVTGTGRSGTGWCAAVLNSAGIFTGHERVFGPKQAAGGLIDWSEYHADCSWMAVPRLPLMGVRAALVVRHPLDVVSSMYQIGFGIGSFDNEFSRVAFFAGTMTPDLDGYLRFWVNWNQDALDVVERVFRFDTLLADPTRLTSWAGARFDPHHPGVVNDRPDWKQHNARVEWSDFTDQGMVGRAQTLWDTL